MQSPLPPTGTAELLETLSAFVPDQFINTLLAARSQPGPRPFFSAAQLWRIHLLALLTPAHSFNAVVRLLPEQRAWRRFARLPHRQRTPDVRMLHEFRARAGVAALRTINEHLVKQLLPFLPAGGQAEARSEKSHAAVSGGALRVGTTRAPGTGGAAGTEAKAQCSTTERGRSARVGWNAN